MNNNINLIVAYSKNNGIGLNNTLPWKISSDLKKFKKLTRGKGNNAIIMGKNTYESIKKPLPNRDNLILSSTLTIDTKENNIVKSFANLEILYEFIKTKNYDEIWVIGGSKIYELFLNIDPKFEILIPEKIFVTFIDQEFMCDTFFPLINTKKYCFISQEIHKTQEEENKYKIFDIIYKKI